MRPTTTIAALGLAGLAFAAMPAAAQEVGTATAVNPTSEGTPPGAATTTLAVGARIVHNERIHTTPTGSLQLLFTDHSSMSVSANADLVIDEYVYDPNSGSGHLLATLSKGALRYVGGKLSHQGEATIATPVATIGIRGAIATFMQVKGGWQFTDNYGILTISNNAGTTTLERPGFSVLVASRNTLPGPATAVTTDMTDHQLYITTSLPGQDGGVPGLKSVHVGECGVGLVPGNPSATQGAVCPDKPWINTDAGESDAFQIIQQANQHATSQIVLPARRPPGR